MVKAQDWVAFKRGGERRTGQVCSVHRADERPGDEAYCIVYAPDSRDRYCYMTVPMGDLLDGAQ